ncbi:hypothetical protein KJ877_01705 [bacterium]|nr:hypothetical protein [bacterium]MBU1989979.1 hypothetical protein [bacterium]
MFSNILGKKKDASSDKNLIEKVSKMNLTDMRLFVNNKNEITEEGLIEVLNRLIDKNEKTSKRYIEADDMDSKIKKSFDLLINIASNKKITVVAVEKIQEFIEVYSEIIRGFDEKNKQIYGSKLKEALEKAIGNIEGISEFKRKMNLLGE